MEDGGDKEDRHGCETYLTSQVNEKVNTDGETNLAVTRPCTEEFGLTSLTA